MSVKSALQSFILLILIAVLAASCGENTVGYLEIRNNSPFKLENVSWGDTLIFGTILPGEEDGVETELSGSEYVHMNILGTGYRSGEPVRVDARTSATFIVKDTADLDRGWVD